MTLHGHIENGHIVLDEIVPLPEGASVEVRIAESRTSDSPVAKPNGINPTLAERLKDFIGVLEDLPEDAARNHDHYLYDAPKHQ